MDKLNLPSFNSNIKKSAGKSVIFDVIRKKYLILTPEEWVRQHFVHYLINQLGYSRSLITIEQGLKYNKLQKRTDIIVFNRLAKPLVLIECKATSQRLNQKVMDQALMYNRSINAKFIIITNGLEHSCLKVIRPERKVEYLNSIPRFEEIDD